MDDNIQRNKGENEKLIRVFLQVLIPLANARETPVEPSALQ